jgi:hypothetical protein
MLRMSVWMAVCVVIRSLGRLRAPCVDAVLSDKNTPQADARGAYQVGSCEACIQYSRRLDLCVAAIVSANC